MSVTTYTIGCGYDLSKLKNQVYFLNKNHQWTIDVDNGEASATFVNASPYPQSANRLDGFNIKLQETESLDERYKFTKNLTMSINGHLTDASWLMEGDYYLVVETEDGTYYLINVDFPSKMTYTYNLSEGQNQTDFTFTSNSNYPTLKFNWTPTDYTTCKTYNVYGIDKLELLEKDYTTLNSEQSIITLFDGHEFNNVDFLKNTITLQESYDGDKIDTTISFDIPFDNYKTSWQYNLLEFKQNLYVAHITPKNSSKGLFCGYEYGLQPSYQIDGATTNGDSTKITITLTESSQWGIFELGSWTYLRNTSKKWIGVDSEHICVAFGIGSYLLMQEVDGNGTPTGRYKCLDGYEDRYNGMNIVGTYDEAPTFETSDCARSMTRRMNSDTYYTCIDGDKYSVIFPQMSYDNEKTWINIKDYELGDLVESGSSFCEIEPQVKWELDRNKWDCISQFERWIPSGYTCINGDKYQNNYKQVSDDHETWYTPEPIQWSASTVIEYDSEDCIFYRWIPTTSGMCVGDEEPIVTPMYRTTTSGTPYCGGYTGYDKLVDVTKEVSTDGGATWEYYDEKTFVVEENSDDCLYSNNPYYSKYFTIEAVGEIYVVFGSSNQDIYVSFDEGESWMYYWNDYTTIHLNDGEKVSIKANRNTPVTFRTTMDKTFNVYGNVMSMFYGDDFVGERSYPSSSTTFQNYFSGASVVNAENLVLPAREVVESCYNSMFRDCTNLTKAPKVIPVIDLPQNACLSMFWGCTSLTTAPQIAAKSMGSGSCGHMFHGCTSLVTLPNNMLPARIGVDYYYMFSGCTSLVTAPELPATSGSYVGMFYDCTSLTTAPSILPFETATTQCCWMMFYGCTALTTPPQLPATTLEQQCYGAMFHDCTSLTIAPELPAETLAVDCYHTMFYGCTSLSSIKMLATNISATRCLQEWVSGVSSSGTFTKAASMTSLPSGDSGIPNNWTIIDYTA